MPELFPLVTPVSFAPDLIARYREQGFVQLPGFFDAEEVALVRTELARFIAQVVPGMPASEVFYEVKGDRGSLKQLQRMFQWDDFFERLFLKSRFFALAEHLLGRPALGKNMQYFNKPAGIGAPNPPEPAPATMRS